MRERSTLGAFPSTESTHAMQSSTRTSSKGTPLRTKEELCATSIQTLLRCLRRRALDVDCSRNDLSKTAVKLGKTRTPTWAMLQCTATILPLIRKATCTLSLRTGIDTPSMRQTMLRLHRGRCLTSRLKFSIRKDDFARMRTMLYAHLNSFLVKIWPTVPSL